MAANQHFYGIRWHSSKYGSNMPSPIPMYVASGYTPAINGRTDTALALRPGDPVHALSTGYCQLAAGQEAAAAAAETIDGIIVGIKQYWDGEKIVRAGNKLPYSTTYGSVMERRSILDVIPAAGNYFEIDCDDASTATTYAAYLAFIGEAADHTFDVGTVERAGYANPKLDISTHLNSAGQWKIVGVSRTMNNRDFTGLNVKLIVEINEGAALV
jgi:hypothetical protein